MRVEKRKGSTGNLSPASPELERQYDGRVAVMKWKWSSAVAVLKLGEGERRGGSPMAQR
jgi:hypothetical protein